MTCSGSQIFIYAFLIKHNLWNGNLDQKLGETRYCFLCLTLNNKCLIKNKNLGHIFLHLNASSDNISKPFLKCKNNTIKYIKLHNILETKTISFFISDVQSIKNLEKEKVKKMDDFVAHWTFAGLYKWKGIIIIFTRSKL